MIAHFMIQTPRATFFSVLTVAVVGLVIACLPVITEGRPLGPRFSNDPAELLLAAGDRDQNSLSGLENAPVSYSAADGVDTVRRESGTSIPPRHVPAVTPAARGTDVTRKFWLPRVKPPKLPDPPMPEIPEPPAVDAPDLPDSTWSPLRVLSSVPLSTASPVNSDSSWKNRLQVGFREDRPCRQGMLQLFRCACCGRTNCVKTDAYDSMLDGRDDGQDDSRLLESVFCSFCGCTNRIQSPIWKTLPIVWPPNDNRPRAKDSTD